MLDVVNLGELAAGIGRDELLKLGHGLATKIGAIHEKQHALRSGVLDEAVSEAARGVGLARAGGHLDERTRVGCGKRLFEIRDAFDLAGAEILRWQQMGNGHGREPATKRCRLGEPRSKGFRTMKREDAAGTWGGIAFVAKHCFNARGFVEERQRAGRDGLYEIRQVHRVMGGLLGNASQQHTYFFCLNYSDGFSVHEQKIIAGTGFKRRFAQRDAGSGGRTELLVVLNDPAAGNELCIDLLPGALFGSQFRHGACDSYFSLHTARCAVIGSCFFRA